VIETVPFDVIAGFAAGAVVALNARGPLSATPDPLRTRYFVVVLLFAGGALMPAGVVVYTQYPDWALMYLANPAHLSALVMIPVVMALYLGTPVAGFWLTHRFIAQKNERAIRNLLGILVGLSLFIVLFGAGRLLTVAYYDDFHHGGLIVPLYRSPLVWALLLIIFFVCFAFVFSLLQVRRHVELIQAVELPRPDAKDDTIDDIKKRPAT